MLSVTFHASNIIRVWDEMNGRAGRQALNKILLLERGFEKQMTSLRKKNKLLHKSATLAAQISRSCFCLLKRSEWCGCFPLGMSSWKLMVVCLYHPLCLVVLLDVRNFVAASVPILDQEGQEGIFPRCFRIPGATQNTTN